MSGGHEIVLLVEGKTEKAFGPILKRFLDIRCENENKPKVRLTTKPLDSRLLKERIIRDQVTRNLKRPGVRGVVALIDVVCAGRPRQFQDANQAIAFLRNASPLDPRYRAHAAQFEFEAWLLPYWEAICRRLGEKSKAPAAAPETVNHDCPPSRHLKDLYRKAKRDYHKIRDAQAILDREDILVSADRCPQLKSFLNSLLCFAECEEIE